MAKTTKTTKTKKVKVTADDVDTIVVAETTDDVPPYTDITLAKFKKLFKDEIAEAADWLWREDKEGDFENRKTTKAAALQFVIEQHPEYNVTK